MPQFDTDYFEKLLTDAREECKRAFEFPNKDVVLTALSEWPELEQKKKMEAGRHLKRLKKQGGSKEELEAMEAKWDAFIAEQDKMEHEILTLLEPMFEDAANQMRSQSPNFFKSAMRCAILNQAGPANLAKYCEEHGHQHVEELLDNEDMMKEMLINGGAAKGKWGEAYKIYEQLMDVIERSDTDDACHFKLALGIALEHAEPKIVFDTDFDKSEGTIVNPVERFLHYMGAHKNGELDPSFPYFTAWEYRYATDSNASDDQLQWGRDHLRRYRPDQAVMANMDWRYAQAVKSDVGYRNATWTSRPKTYQQLVSGGGKCGPRAWYGRFMCKAFGIPTWGCKQPAHAALVRWTPHRGWDTILGGGIHKSNWDGRGARYFQGEAHARSYMRQNEEEFFIKMTMLECMAEVYNEPLHEEMARFNDKFFWRSLINAQRFLWAAKATPEHFKRGPVDGDKQEDNLIAAYIARRDQPKQDNKIENIDDGILRIPGCAFTSQKNCQPMLCFEGGGQLYLKNEGSEIEYKIPDNVPRQEYDVVCKVCNVHLQHEKQQLVFQAGGDEVQALSVPYTMGEWKHTTRFPITIGGGDTLKISRRGEQKIFGLTMKEILLRPSNNPEQWVLVEKESI